MENPNNSRMNYPYASEVCINDRFWTPYLEKIRHVTLTYVLDKFVECGYLNNYALAAAGASSGFSGPYFSDGLLLETLRGACDFLAAEYDAELDKRLDEMISQIALASDSSPDGFLCTPTMICHPDKRWGQNGGNIVHQHDLYNHGALVEAAVSHYLATRKTTLLRCAVRAANCVCTEIGPEPKKNIVPGHSLPEEAFVKLYRLFRDHGELDCFAAEYGVKPENYLDIAQFWYNARGNYEGRGANAGFTHEYNQDHLPFASQRNAVGHAVRAMLCYTGAAAVAREANRTDYMPALMAIWENTTRKKLHISGGIGTRHDIEGFDEDYNLPNKAYLETCAAVGLAFWSGEMNLLSPKSEYFDVFERALCNNILASVGEDGRHYFYQNPLESDGSIRRWNWHGCPCCPPMLLKFFSALGSYIYAYNEYGKDMLYVNMFIGSSYETDNFKISQYDRAFVIDSHGSELTLLIRIPEYAENFKLNYGESELAFDNENGYAKLRRVWSPNETLRVGFSEEPRRICANTAVGDDTGRVAIMRGPWLMCAEGIDNDGDVDPELAQNPKLMSDGETVTCLAVGGRRLRLIPYHRWCNRDGGVERDSAMRVWFKQNGMPPAAAIDRAMKGELYYEYDKIL